MTERIKHPDFYPQRIKSLEADIGRLTAQRDAVLALHPSPDLWRTCVTCGQPWPCETRRALGVEQ